VTVAWTLTLITAVLGTEAIALSGTLFGTEDQSTITSDGDE